MRLVRRCLPLIAVLLLTGYLTAQPIPSSDAEKIAQLQQQVAQAQGSADNAWMLVSSALVLMMTGLGWRCFMEDWCARRMCWAP